jgi:hypothetical protein
MNRLFVRNPSNRIIREQEDRVTSALDAPGGKNPFGGFFISCFVSCYPVALAILDCFRVLYSSGGLSSNKCILRNTFQF